MTPSSSSGDEAGQVRDNLPGLSSVTDLEEFERRMAYVRVAELEQDPALAGGDFAFDTLREIHGWILQDVYPWAGQLRSTDTQAMGMAHCRPAFLADELHRVFGGITTERPSPVDRESAIATTAHHGGELTAGVANIFATELSSA